LRGGVCEKRSNGNIFEMNMRGKRKKRQKLRYSSNLKKTHGENKGEENEKVQSALSK
jgi:hypothetical protein